MAIITKRKIVPTAKLTGRANALTRGQGKKIGLKRKMGVPTGSKRPVPPIVKPPTPPGMATLPAPGTKVVNYPSEGPRMAEWYRKKPGTPVERRVGVSYGPYGNEKSYTVVGPATGPQRIEYPGATSAPKPQVMPFKGTGGSVLTKAIAAATAKRKLTGRANALTRGRGKKIGLRRLPVRRPK